MTREEATRILDAVIPPPEHHTVDLDHLRIAQAWAYVKETLTAEPVKHGMWLSVKVMDDEADFGEADGAECSVCGYTTNSDYWAKTYYKFCPNCGARMDLIGEDKSHPFAESVMMGEQKDEAEE